MVMKLLHEALAEAGLQAKREGAALVLPNGLRVEAELLEVVESGRALRTATLVRTTHPELFPQGVFEYQHAWGETDRASLASGFATWVQTDLVALRAALQHQPQELSVVHYSFDDEQGRYDRQVLLGPCVHQQTRPPAEPESCEDGHAFCPCCLFTRSFEAFQQPLRSREFVGLRMYVARDEHGEVMADCRVNGHDYTEALPHLTAYARTWPDRGFEVRKQYVVIRNPVPRAQAPGLFTGLLPGQA